MRSASPRSAPARACSTSRAAPATSRGCSPNAAGPTGRVVLTDINGAMLAEGRDKLLDARPRARRGAMRRREAAVSRPVRSTSCRSASGCATSRARRTRSPRCAACSCRGASRVVLEFSKVATPLAPAYDWYSFACCPVSGALVAGDEASYRYLAESIRMHPDQETLKAHDGTGGLRVGRIPQPHRRRGRVARGSRLLTPRRAGREDAVSRTAGAAFRRDTTAGVARESHVSSLESPPPPWPLLAADLADARRMSGGTQPGHATPGRHADPTGDAPVAGRRAGGRKRVERDRRRRRPVRVPRAIR